MSFHWFFSSNSTIFGVCLNRCLNRNVNRDVNRETTINVVCYEPKVLKKQ